MGSLSPVLAKTVPRRSPYQHWKIYQEEVLPLSKTAFKQNPPLPICPLFQIFKESAKETTDFEDFICSLVDIPKKSSCGISLFFYFSLVGSNSSQHPKVCLSDPGRKRCLHTCGLCVGFFLLQLLLSFWAPASRASVLTPLTHSLCNPPTGTPRHHLCESRHTGTQGRPLVVNHVCQFPDSTAGLSRSPS